MSASEQTSASTPCWYVKDFADGWIKFYDHDMACDEAIKTGAIMQYSITGKPPQCHPDELAKAFVPRSNSAKADEIVRLFGELSKAQERIRFLEEAMNAVLSETAKSMIENYKPKP